MDYGNSTRNAHVCWLPAARVQWGIHENKNLMLGNVLSNAPLMATMYLS